MVRYGDDDKGEKAFPAYRIDRKQRDPPAAASRATLASAGCVGLGVLLFSRLHYAPKYLFFFDNANFAFALRRFDPALHQPQPPGYPLFVALLHAIDLLANDANRALIIAGLLGSAVALALLWLWTNSMLGRSAAYMATVLLLLHPVFWVAGVANPVRVFLAVVATGAGWAAWETMTSATPARAFYRAAAILGLAAGFRPETLVLLAPMWLTVGLYRRLSGRAILIGFSILLASTATWLTPMAVRMGGFGPMWRVFAEYVRIRSIGYTVAYGASAGQSLTTIRRALIWTLGMTVVWIWVLPLVWRRFRSLWDQARILLIVVALLPALLFHMLIHVRDIDQTLISIPITCIVGGAVLASISSRKAMVAACLVALFGSYWCFRRPFFSDMTGASGSGIRWVEAWTSSTYEALDRIGSEPGTTLVWYGAVVPWRNVSYYYPNLPLLVISTDAPFWVRGGSSEPPTIEPDGAVGLPSSTKHIILGLSSVESDTAAHGWPEARRVGPLICLDVNGGERLQLGGLGLHVER